MVQTIATARSVPDRPVAPGPALRILTLVHGYPPRENAGTEQHTFQLVHALQGRGHAVHVIAATRSPGRRHLAVIDEPGVTRIVTNVPGRPLGHAERDRAVEAIARRITAAFRPDVAHVQHLQFLSSGLRFAVPVVATLHDAWAWCPAGGTLLHADGGVCAGPAPRRSAPCYQRWRPTPSTPARALLRLAGALAPLVAPERLHGLYQALPPRLRLRAARGEGPAPSAAAAVARADALREFYRRAHTRVAPSAFLARAAEAAELGPVGVVRHGVPPQPRRYARRGGSLLVLGTVAHHKGTDVVVRAWRRAFPDGRPGLRIHGPVQDASVAAGHPIGAPLDRAGVSAALAQARALVMGSRWPENAPLVISEARAAGCPVIAPAIGGIPELVEPGVDGWLYPPEDVAALVERLSRPLDGLRPRPPRSLSAQVDDMERVLSAAAEDG